MELSLNIHSGGVASEIGKDQRRSSPIDQAPRTFTAPFIAINSSPRLFFTFGIGPGFIHVHSIRVLNRLGDQLWKWDGDYKTLSASSERKVFFFPATENIGAVALVPSKEHGIDLSQVDLDWEQLLLGGTLEVCLSSPDNIGHLISDDNTLAAYFELQRAYWRLNSLLERQGAILRRKRILEERWRGKVRSVLRSTSWRLTGPLRVISRFVRRTCRQPTLFKIFDNSRKQSERSSSTILDVIIPVYAGFDSTRRCLDSVIKSRQDARFEIIVVDDKSTDPEIVEYLNTLASDASITLIRNDYNLGFAGAVNRAMKLHHDRDVILLNSDTEVSSNWIDRLHRCAYSEKSIATVTPFSNNATICSYPKFCDSNDLPAGWTVSQLDNAMKVVNEGQKVEIPTAVGFCMYIKRACLKQIGLFDDITFKSYGEENDFCWQAKRLGWKHVLCADTFVYHEAHVSYGTAHKDKEIHAIAKLNAMYPDYKETVQAHISKDPARPFRDAVDLKRFQSSKKPIILFVSHSMSGGVERHVEELATFVGSAVNVLVLRPKITQSSTAFELSWKFADDGFKITFANDQFYNLVKLLETLQIARIHIHSSIGFGSELRQLVEKLNVPFDLTIHDYYTVCPRIKLCIDEQGYCGQPDNAACNKCLATDNIAKGKDIASWRRQHEWQLVQAARVIVPSSDTMTRVKKYYPQVPMVLTPHPDAEFRYHPRPRHRPIKALDGVLHVAIIGAISVEKGALILDECARDARKRSLPVQFHLIGHAYPEPKSVPHSNLIVYGGYKDEDLTGLLSELPVHLAWFPVIWPETYSYTLSACLEVGMPLVLANLGALPERVAGRQWTWVRDWQSSARDWNDFFVSIASDCIGPAKPPDPQPGSLPSADFSYAVNYLAPLGISPIVL